LSMHASLSQQGFHLSARTTIPVSSSLVRHCSLHVLYVLVPDLYADQHELAQRTAYRVQLHGSDDLELPVAAVASADSVLLLHAFLAENAISDLTLDVPLHARYGNPVPASQSPYHSISLRPPTAFWACPTSGTPESTAPKPVPNNLAAAHSMPDDLAPYVPPKLFPSSRLSVIPYDAFPHDLEVTIPVGVSDDLRYIDVGTAAVMLLMFAYLVSVSVKTARRLYPRPTKAE
ncbi:PIG-X, partial [Sparassis latifolia]